MTDTTARHLLFGADGETISAVLTMTTEDALMNTTIVTYDELGEPVEETGSLFSINPETDNGALIDNAEVKFSGGALVSVADDTPIPAFAEFEFAEQVPL